MQQDDEDKKNEIVVKAFEDKIRKLEDSLKEKGSLLHSTEGSLAEDRAQNERLSKELKETQILLEENSSRFSRETKGLNMTIKVEAEKNLKLSEALKALKNKCFNFVARCTARLKVYSIQSETYPKKPVFLPKISPEHLNALRKKLTSSMKS
jgi:septal ring factor EnvC (AmiA/AmiB activator)